MFSLFYFLLAIQNEVDFPSLFVIKRDLFSHISRPCDKMYMRSNTFNNSRIFPAMYAEKIDYKYFLEIQHSNSFVCKNVL